MSAGNQEQRRVADEARAKAEAEADAERLADEAAAQHRIAQEQAAAAAKAQAEANAQTAAVAAAAQRAAPRLSPWERPKTERVRVEPGSRLVTVENGFYRGAYLEPGDEFTFDGKFMPRWAAAVGTKPPKKPEALNPDTKPAAAALAAKAKISKSMGG